MNNRIRTSATDPIRIATLSVGEGRIGISFCPGKQGASLDGLGWRRDLAADLDAIRNWGAAALVSLIEDHEMRDLNVASLGLEAERCGMEWHHLPIRDVTAPDELFEQRWRHAGARLRALLTEGKGVFVHCRGGLGRAGTVAARLLIEMGEFDATGAIAQVRSARPGAIETSEQEGHLRGVWARRDRAIGCLLGLAVGDAVGTTLEFMPRDSYEHLTDMVGGGPFDLAPGTWTDDTAMALALADSLIASAAKGALFEPMEAQKRFVDWWRHGAYSPTGECFDIGLTTREALARFESTGDPSAGSDDPNAAGNGSLMRLAPVAIWGVNHDPGDVIRVAHLQSRTTHAAPACLDACTVYALTLRAAINGAVFEDAIVAGQGDYSDIIAPIVAGSWREKSRDQILSSGFVAHSLEAALWCVAKTDSFQDAVLLAANLGDDADTTAAITGQLAGALYGNSGIPSSWLHQLAWREKIEELACTLLFPTFG